MYTFLLLQLKKIEDVAEYRDTIDSLFPERFEDGFPVPTHLVKPSDSDNSTKALLVKHCLKNIMELNYFIDGKICCA